MATIVARELNKWPAFAVRDKELGRFDGGYHDLLSARQLLTRWVFQSAKDSDLALSMTVLGNLYDRSFPSVYHLKSSNTDRIWQLIERCDNDRHNSKYGDSNLPMFVGPFHSIETFFDRHRISLFKREDSVCSINDWRLLNDRCSVYFNCELGRTPLRTPDTWLLKMAAQG